MSETVVQVEPVEEKEKAEKEGAEKEMAEVEEAEKEMAENEMAEKDIEAEISEGNAIVDRQLVSAKKSSIAQLANNLEAAKSAFTIQESGEPNTFCSETISWYNPLLRNFQTFVSILVVLCLFFNSYMFFFNASQMLFNLGTAADVLFTYIMFLRSRTGHMIDGVEERNLLKIRERYQTSLAFFLDVLSLFPISQLRWLAPGSDQFFYAVGRQKQYVRLHFVLYYLGIREGEPGSSTLLYRTLKYALLSTLTIHFTACGWYGLACSRSDESGFNLSLCSGNSWIMYLPQHILEKVLRLAEDKDAALDSEVSFLHNTYITSLYWASATATSTGYGDIHAYTIPEKIYSVFSMIIGMMVLYGMTMGGMTSMLTNIDARRSSFVHRFRAFQNEVDRMGVTENVKGICIRYFDYLWHRWEGEDVQASGILHILPESLRASFAEATFQKLVRKADLLDATEDAFCRNLALVAQPMVYLENQFVQRAGEIANNMCYIQHGIVEVLDSDEEEVLAMMHSGKLFGQILLVFDLPRINSIRCKTNCDIFILNKHDFRQVLSEYPQAAEQFVEAARIKCTEGDNQWPMNPPKYTDYTNFVEKTTKHKRRMSVVDTTEVAAPSSNEAKAPDQQMARRMTTVYSTDYDGVDLSRVVMHRTKAKMDLERAMVEDSTGPKPSMVDFVVRGNPAQVGRRSSTVLQDGTKIIAKNANYEDLKEAVAPDAKFDDPDVTTWKERLFNLTIINPKHLFYKFWINYMFVISLFTGIYTTFMAFFTTTPGQEMTYSGMAATELDLLSIAADSCNTAVTSAIASNCSSMTGFASIAQCIQRGSSMFGSMITGSGANISVTVPSTYDISWVGYNPSSDEGRLHIFISYFLIDLTFYANIFINFRTEVLTPNGFLTSFKDISNNYNKWNKLWLDVLGVLPLEIISPSIGCSRIAKYHAMAFLRMNRILYFLRYVPSSFTRWEYSLNVKIVRIRTLKFVAYIYSFTHMCSCAYYWWSCGYGMQSHLDRISYKCRFGSWAWVFDIGYASNRAQDYIKTMYWASTTMTSTGYGDISASTTTGRMFALATMIIGTVMYGWLVAVIASTVSNSEAAEVSFRNSMLATKKYLEVHAVKKALVDRVMNVRRIEWERYFGTATPGIQTIGRELPKQLHSVLLYESVNKFVEGLPFFHGVDTSFIAMLCNHVIFYHYSEGDVIIYEGDLSRNLYIIKQGHCDIVTEDLGEIIDHLAPGDYFGEIEILFGCGSPRTVVADTACEVIVIQRGDIDIVLQSFPVLQAQMKKIEDDALYRERVLHAIQQRNSSSRMGVTMTDRYNIEEIEGGTVLYADHKVPTPLLHPVSKEDSGSSLARFLLLPVTFDPLSKHYMMYEGLRVLLTVITLVLVPLQFSILPCASSLLVLQYLLDFLSLVDQYVKAHTSYFDDRSVAVTQSVETAKHYLRKSFAVDLISWFPFELLVLAGLGSNVSEMQWRLVAILRLNRILQLYKVFGFLSYWLSDIRSSRRWLKHLSSVLYGFILHHWFACLLFMSACPPESINNDALYQASPEMVALNATGSVTYCQNTTWVGTLATQSVFPALDLMSSTADQYIVSLYWATATLVCVGYGDIHARMQTEMFMATCVMIIGTVYYSSILGDISANIQTDDIRRGHYKGKLSDILKFFKVYDVTKETQRQVLNYYCYLWDRTQGVSPDYLLIGLPPSIRTSVCQSMYDPMIREAFGEGGAEIDKETQGFFRLMSTHIQPALYLKQSIICRRGDIGDEMFFIQRGNVAILEDDDETVCKVLGPGQHFGEVALLLATPRSRTIKALTNCDLNVLSKKDLDEILNKFPRFRERMTNIAKDRTLKGTRSITYTQTPSQASIMRGSLYDQDGNRLDGTDKQKFTKVLDRESTFAKVWNNITVLFAFLSASMCIYQACFYSHFSTFYIFGYILDVWFALDMIINFHMSYFDQFSTNMDDQMKIHARYAKSPHRFLLDAVANAPFDLIAHMVGSKVGLQLAVLSYARLNRVLRMFKLVQIFSEWEKDIRKDVLVVRMYKFLLFVCFTVNAVGSVWFALACPNSQCKENTWSSSSVTDYKKKMIFGHMGLPWVDSVYWAVATMTSTGYGDIKPENQTEMVYSCCVMVLGKLVIGYVLGMVAATLANDESLRVWYEQSVTAVRTYMVDLKFKKELFEHVIQYYDYMWMKNQGVNVMDLFPDLTFSLRADIYNQICRDMVNSIELFEGCPENFLRHLCMVMNPTAFMPGDYICLQGDIRCEMFVIHHGVAEAMKVENGVKIPIRLVMEGEHFLCESILCKTRRPCSLRARTYVDVFSMTLDGLQSVLNYHPEVRPIILANARRLYPDVKL